MSGSARPSHPSPDRRPAAAAGFTLLELLVTLAVIAILIGLILAGVQRVRAAAARAACGNNLRQVGLALHQYHGSHGRFPPGMDPPGQPGRLAYLAWSARVLPYLDQQSLWAEIGPEYRRTPVPWDPPRHRSRDRRLPVFFCPADPRGPAGDPDRPGPSWFMGVAGTRSVARDGMLFLGSAVRLADVTDGASTTLLVGERPPSADWRFGWWHSGWGQPLNGSAFDAYLGVADENFPQSPYDPEFRCPPGPYEFQAGRASDQCDTFHFWSPHPGGAHFAFADGSARFVGYHAAPLLPALATRAGGEAAPHPE